MTSPTNLPEKGTFERLTCHSDGSPCGCTDRPTPSVYCALVNKVPVPDDPVGIAHNGGPDITTWADSEGSLTSDTQGRTEYPMADGLLDYFPNALAEVAKLSYAATKQHHPDEEMHWARGKSTDHRNKIMRHLVDTGKRDDKGMRHSAMVAWRALALLQEELEEDEGAPLSRASRPPQ